MLRYDLQDRCHAHDNVTLVSAMLEFFDNSSSALGHVWTAPWQELF
jgi:hypothetical protein